MEVVPADSTVSIAYSNPNEWNFESVECFSGKFHEGIIKVFEDSQQPIQAVSSKNIIE